MVFSCLVEPLVPPLVSGGSRGSALQRSGVQGSALTKSRLAATAIACATLLAVSGSAEAEALAAHAKPRPAATKVAEAEKPAVRNAHQKPAPIPYRDLLATVFAASLRRAGEDELAEPALAPDFEQNALDVHRLKHKRDIARDQSPGLGISLRIDRLRGGTLETYLRFGSGRHLSGLPIPA